MQMPAEWRGGEPLAALQLEYSLVQRNIAGDTSRRRRNPGWRRARNPRSAAVVRPISAAGAVWTMKDSADLAVAKMRDQWRRN
jgi:hypothetical protein